MHGKSFVLQVRLQIVKGWMMDEQLSILWASSFGGLDFGLEFLTAVACFRQRCTYASRPSEGLEHLWSYCLHERRAASSWQEGPCCGGSCRLPQRSHARKGIVARMKDTCWLQILSTCYKQSTCGACVSLKGLDPVASAFQYLDPESSGFIDITTLKRILGQVGTGSFCSQVHLYSSRFSALVGHPFDASVGRLMTTTCTCS